MAEEMSDGIMPVQTQVNCSPKGDWFSLVFRSSLGGPIQKNTHYMQRQHVEQLHRNLGKLLEETSEGKIRTSKDALRSEDAHAAFVSSHRRAREQQGPPVSIHDGITPEEAPAFEAELREIAAGAPIETIQCDPRVAAGHAQLASVPSGARKAGNYKKFVPGEVDVLLCANCGKPRKEHSKTGYCKGILGKKEQS